jgi:hypothetical protein
MENMTRIVAAPRNGAGNLGVAMDAELQNDIRARFAALQEAQVIAHAS